MQRLEFIGAVRPIYGSLGVKRLTSSNSKSDIQLVKTWQHVPWPTANLWPPHLSCLHQMPYYAQQRSFCLPTGWQWALLDEYRHWYLKSVHSALNKLKTANAKGKSAFQVFFFPQRQRVEHVNTPWGNTRTAGLQQLALTLRPALYFRNSLNINHLNTELNPICQ